MPAAENELRPTCLGLVLPLAALLSLLSVGGAETTLAGGPVRTHAWDALARLTSLSDVQAGGVDRRWAYAYAPGSLTRLSEVEALASAPDTPLASIAYRRDDLGLLSRTLAGTTLTSVGPGRTPIWEANGTNGQATVFIGPCIVPGVGRPCLPPETNHACLC